MFWAGYVKCVSGKRNSHRVLGGGGEPEWKTPLERPSNRREDNVKMYFKMF
jgi:hypothetical protein